MEQVNEQKTTFIKIGDFFFKYRNYLFPILLLSMFLGRRPPSSYFGSEELEDIIDTIAILITLSGLAMRSAVIGFRYIKRGGLNKKVYAANLVTDGFFGVCRNPLYVGNMLVCEGLLLKHGDPVVFMLGSAFFIFVYQSIIAAEEFFLRREFGAAYAAYCQDVPRWRMRWSRLKNATEGMKFNLKRALVKDYSTITNTLIALIALEYLEEENNPLAAHEWQVFVAMVVAVLLVALSVRIAKKRGVLQV